MTFEQQQQQPSTAMGDDCDLCTLQIPFLTVQKEKKLRKHKTRVQPLYILQFFWPFFEDTSKKERHETSTVAQWHMRMLKTKRQCRIMNKPPLRTAKLASYETNEQ
ncbi:hypothetical protein T01_6861 [Trichinella spiralis]|uniref:Uncharacterized protein n=1 Tax=Trichinella spiralis TaxID=6334 RepID=A0A0V1C1C6_TRISP|nr:hypothetical protein T01_6861 [Trichinella spiralis]